MAMNRNLQRVVVACVALLLTSIPAIAHHSVQAEFKINQKTTVTAVITRIDWINPHTYFYLDAKDADGTVQKWTGESYPTGFFHRAGITRNMFNVGDTVTIVMFLAKDGTKNYGWIHTMILPSGRTITFDNNDQPTNE
jgi:hypothetical protein